MADPKEKVGDTLPRASHDDPMIKPQGDIETKEVAAASVALEAAIAEAKPSMLSKGMLKLWAIMGIGYLVSTLNGFGRLRCGKEQLKCFWV